MTEFTRGAVRLHILYRAGEGEIHGAWIAQELAEHGYAISPGTLYPLLHRMEQEGLLVSRQVTASGRVRRLYFLTQQGRAELAEQRQALAELAREVLGEPASPGAARRDEAGGVS